MLPLPVLSGCTTQAKCGKQAKTEDTRSANSRPSPQKTRKHFQGDSYTASSENDYRDCCRRIEGSREERAQTILSGQGRHSSDPDNSVHYLRPAGGNVSETLRSTDGLKNTTLQVKDGSSTCNDLNSRNSDGNQGCEPPKVVGQLEACPSKHQQLQKMKRLL